MKWEIKVNEPTRTANEEKEHVAVVTLAGHNTDENGNLILSLREVKDLALMLSTIARLLEEHMNETIRLHEIERQKIIETYRKFSIENGTYTGLY